MSYGQQNWFIDHPSMRPVQIERVENGYTATITNPRDCTRAVWVFLTSQQLGMWLVGWDKERARLIAEAKAKQ